MEEIIESTPINNKTNDVAFKGKGFELLGIYIINWLLICITLGLYYPWARVTKLRFVYQNTLLNNTGFVFTGNGKELFKGFIRFYLVLAFIISINIFATTTESIEIYSIVKFLTLIFFLIIVPLAIHGALRYRLSRTNWRGIHLGYRGDRIRLLWDFCIGYFLLSFTFGIYTSWFVNNIRKYIFQNLRFGNLYFGYDGKGIDLFLINIKGIIFSILTLGIYYFWYRAEYIRYFAKHIYIKQFENTVYVNAEYKGSSLFMLHLVNFFILLFTLGLGYAFTEIRAIKFIINNLTIPSEINLDAIDQTEDDYSDAIGEDIVDFFDLGIA